MDGDLAVILRFGPYQPLQIYLIVRVEELVDQLHPLKFLQGRLLQNRLLVFGQLLDLLEDESLSRRPQFCLFRDVFDGDEQLDKLGGDHSAGPGYFVPFDL